MKIAITNCFLPSDHSGGVAWQVHGIANALVERGHEVCVYTFSDRPADARYAVNRYPKPPLTKSTRPFFMAGRVATTDFSDFDVVNCHGDNYLIGRSRPILRTFHGSASDELRSAPTFRRKVYYALSSMLEWIGARRADRIIGVSDTTRKSVHAVESVIACGVDLARFHPGEKAERPTVLFVGTEEGRKRGRWFADVFENSVAPHVPDAELIIVSDGDVGVEGAIRRVGRVDTAELASLYRRAWVFVLPSTYEGFGVPFIEAMASGTAVVATKGNPGANEVLSEGAFGMISDDQALAATVVGLLQNTGLRSEFSSKGLSRSRDFGWNSIAEKYERELTIATERHAARASKRR